LGYGEVLWELEGQEIPPTPIIEGAGTSAGMGDQASDIDDLFSGVDVDLFPDISMDTIQAEMGNYDMDFMENLWTTGVLERH
jgi:hypothetical protein